MVIWRKRDEQLLSQEKRERQAKRKRQKKQQRVPKKLVSFFSIWVPSQLIICGLYQIEVHKYLKCFLAGGSLRTHVGMIFFIIIVYPHQMNLRKLVFLYTFLLQISPTLVYFYFKKVSPHLSLIKLGKNNSYLS